MTLDANTLYLMGGLLVLLTGIFFLMETILRHNDAVGRLWIAFFIGAMFATFAYVVGLVDHEANWWATAVGNGAYTASVGFLWAGARRANGGRPLLSIAIAGGAAVALAALVRGPEGGYWAGAAEMFLGMAVFAVLTARECSRGELRRLVSARLLATLLIALAAFYLVRAAAFVLLGPDDGFFSAVFGAESSSIAVICMVVVGTLALSSVQGDRFRRGAHLDAESGLRVTIEGAVGRETFRELSESWLVRSVRERSTLVLLIIEIADLAEINLAFGRAAGDAAIRTAARIALAQAPAAVLVGHISPRRFALLMPAAGADAVEAVGDRIRDAVLNSPIDERDRFRASIFRGVASTRTAGARFDDLFRAAAEAVALDASAARTAPDDAPAAPRRIPTTPERAPTAVRR